MYPAGCLTTDPMCCTAARFLPPWTEFPSLGKRGELLEVCGCLLPIASPLIQDIFTLLGELYLVSKQEVKARILGLKMSRPSVYGTVFFISLLCNSVLIAH